jgi:hypothetical protein
MHQEDIMIITIYAPNIGAPYFIKQTLLDIKGQIDSDIITACDFTTPISSIDRPQ